MLSPEQFSLYCFVYHFCLKRKLELYNYILVSKRARVGKKVPLSKVSDNLSSHRDILKILKCLKSANTQSLLEEGKRLVDWQRHAWWKSGYCMHTVEIKSEGTRRSYTVHACTFYSAWQKAIDTVKILICSESDQVKIDKNKGTSTGLQNFCRIPDLRYWKPSGSRHSSQLCGRNLDFWLKNCKTI